MRDLLKPMRGVEARGKLVGERLVVDKAVCAGRANGLFVEAHSVNIAAFDAGSLRRNQGRTVLEVLGAGLCPELKLLMVGLQRRQKARPLISRCLVVVCRRRQRTVEMVFGLLDHADIRPQEWRCLALAVMAAW